MNKPVDYSQLWQEFFNEGAFNSGNQLGLPSSSFANFSQATGPSPSGLNPSSYLSPGGVAPGGGSGIGNWFQQNGSMITGGLSALSGLTSLYGQLKSIGLAEDAFDFEVDKFNMNYDAKRKDYENALRDQWYARTNAQKARGNNSGPTEEQFLEQRNLAARSG
jgi:hypothetical protein